MEDLGMLTYRLAGVSLSIAITAGVITGWGAADEVQAQETHARQAKQVPELKRRQDTVKVAVAQMMIDQASLNDENDPVDELIPWMDRAEKAHADLLVFPEYLLGAFHIDDPMIKKLRDQVRKRNLNVIVGGWEYLPGQIIKHPPKPKTYANTVLVIDRGGNVAGKHRKMHPALGANSPYCWPPEPGERGEHTMVLGNENGVIDLDFGRIGLLTCYDGYFFESFQMPSLRGAEVLVWVNARGGMVEPHVIQAASFITCTHVVASNQSVGCGSAICSYPGWRLDHAAPAPGEEAFLVGDLDLKEIRIQRRNNRMLHQRRPEVYQTIAEKWQPWTAYPDIEPFRYSAESTAAESAIDQ
ncbi:carbon-nitrogen hydrolase family protein [Roseiconus lacunae]|nr:carbon-nitrogen hydrolase family protein [Roseiconus lacunae]